MKQRLRSHRTGDGRDTFSDRMLAERLYRTFEQAPEADQVRGVHFYVQHGTVTLYGTVRHRHDRDDLAARVREIPGVKGVVTRLQTIDPYHQVLRVDPSE
jgi:osmotically-inducible protein OsmY